MHAAQLETLHILLTSSWLERSYMQAIMAAPSYYQGQPATFVPPNYCCAIYGVTQLATRIGRRRVGSHANFTLSIGSSLFASGFHTMQPAVPKYSLSGWSDCRSKVRIPSLQRTISVQPFTDLNRLARRNHTIAAALEASERELALSLE